MKTCVPREIWRNLLIKPDYQPEPLGSFQKKTHHFRIFVHEGLEIVSFISLDMYIYMYLYMVLSSPIEQPVASVGVICSKESLLCSFLEVSKKTHLGAEIVAELTAWL